MAVTMREVAQRAGVSKTAVSYVLNGRDATMRIPDETRQRILKAVRELGYHPNALARSLAHKETRAVAVVMQYPALFSGWSGFTNELMHGITDAAVRLGYDVMLHTRNAAPDWQDGTVTAKPSWTCSTSPSGTVSERQSGAVDAAPAEVANLTDGRVDGALLLRDLNDPLARILSRRGFPAVLMFTHSDDPEQWYVDCDNIAGARIAVEHLLALGRRRIIHLAGPVYSGAGRDRREGYRLALRQAGVPVIEDHILELASPLADFTGAMRLFARSGSECPDAIFAWSDDVAIQMISALKREGLRVPEDVAVVGFDSTPLCDHTSPPLTSVRQPIYEMAARALELLTDRLQHRTPAQHQVRVMPTLTVRRSCGATDILREG